ncbi:hypothetical protein [Pseudonocardia endophytica]|uniref:Uncharacterized protein n=1 Tax=Pseudonocardia endophytica TaxID=401976 RepID=A0A4R1HHL4_PSEEN|nr:hypothetical protein [Pseudonocardia endophytica]TCK21734.1 hypothetical protein EV378_5725 [Pseudonocardia endophytica]
MIRLTRFATVVVGVLVLLGLSAGPASAHSAGLSAEASLPRVLALDPPVPGLTVTVVEGGARFQIVNATTETVRVLPPDGLAVVEEPTVAPGGRDHWADRRVVVSTQRPADGAPVAWSVPLFVGSEAVTLRGETVWPPAPAGWAWWVATVVVAAATALLGSRAPTRRGAALGIAVLALAAVVAHLVHVLGSALVPVDAAYWPTVFGTAGIGVGAWVVVLVGAVLTVVRVQWGLLLSSLGGAVLALVTVFDTGSFVRAVLPYGWDPALDRVATVAAVGIGAGLFLTGFAVLRAMTPDDLDQEPAPTPVPEEHR